jgi:hypothetical protein
MCWIFHFIVWKQLSTLNYVIFTSFHFRVCCSLSKNMSCFFDIHKFSWECLQGLVWKIEYCWMDERQQNLPLFTSLRVMVLNLKTNKQKNKLPCLFHSYLVIIFLWNPLTLCKNKPTIFLFNHMIIAKILRMKWKNVSFSWKLLPKV